MRRLPLRLAGGAILAIALPAAGIAGRFDTYANPVDLPYRFQSPGVVRREAADPTIVYFKDRYWLFASKSRGYWHSADLRHWTFVAPTGYPANEYAPSALVIDGRLYLTMGGGTSKLFVTDDPARGQWREAGDFGRPFYDPALFRDNDGRLFMYDGLSGSKPLQVTELDRTTFKPLASVPAPATRDTAQRGWEVPGDANDRPDLPTWIEGAWMTKHGERYYLQYAAPGTEYRAYGDGVVVADTPVGPFAPTASSPFAFKPTGFAAGAGHGSTFEARDGRWWHVATMTISQRHVWERRLGLFPATFTPGGALVADTYLGDWPHRLDGDRALVGWMLLSRGKPASASSSAPGRLPALAADEDIRTWWAAASGDPGEWFQLDLGPKRTIEAVQLNFADDGAVGDGGGPDGFRYVLEGSPDGVRWRTLVDHSRHGADAPHDYEVLNAAVTTRFVRLRNVHTPYGARFSLYDLRVFGHAAMPRPAPITGISALRDPADPRHATIRWRAMGSGGCAVVRIAAAGDPPTQNYQVYDGASTLTVRSLNAGVRYTITIDTINERGITRGTVSIAI